MVRPRKCRRVGFDPSARYFKPQGIPLDELEEVTLAPDELEALRLANFEGLSQADGAERLGVHQSTFQRTIAQTRYKLTDALVNGKAIRIGGATMPNRDGTGPDGEGPRTGRGDGSCPGAPRGRPRCGRRRRGA